MARSIPTLVWPGDADVAVSLTFDVDADPVWLSMEGGYRRRLATLSQFRYGIVRGLPRLLPMLRERGLVGTFYVPGATAVAYPEAIRTIAEAGHEIGHHGHDHLRPDLSSAEQQQAEIENGLSVLLEITGARPRGYRAPFAELTPETLALLLKHGFEYDSSCMGDDRPYIEEFDDMAIVELPLHWSLDDFPYFACTLDDGGLLRNPDEVIEIWRAEFRLAVAERRHVTYVMHPEVMGRGPQFVALTRFLDEIAKEAKVWFATHAQVAAATRSAAPLGK